MNALLTRVRQTADAFSPGKDVSIEEGSLLRLAERLKTDYRLVPPSPDRVTEVELFMDLLLASVNYCYWLGRAGYTPAGGGPSVLYAMIREEMPEVSDLTPTLITQAGSRVLRRVAHSGFPLAERRIAHLREVIDQPVVTLGFIREIREGTFEPTGVLELLLTLYPGFTGDPFLKRALLFVHLLHRVRGLFRPEQVAEFPIPADYQVPKYLAHAQVLLYSGPLADLIARGELIPAGSRLELEIRAGSIIACDRLAEASGLTTETVDGFLWGSRKLVNAPHHLTITTDY